LVEDEVVVLFLGLGVGVFFFLAEGALEEVRLPRIYQPLSDLSQPLLVLATTLTAVPDLTVVTLA
jgi:hypothetical protein